MKNITSKEWWKAAAVRAIKTFCQTAVAGISIGAALGDINWANLLSVAAVAMIASVLTSVAGLPEVETT